MQPKLTIEMRPDELYDETDLFIALRSVEVTLTAISRGLDECIVRGEKGDPTSEVEDLLRELATKVGAIGRRVLQGNLSVMRE